MPYALYAQQSGNVFSGNYEDLSNKPVVSAFENDAKYITELQLLNMYVELQRKIDSLKQTIEEYEGTDSCGILTDYDNNTYNTVRIGAQCWMKENLKTTHYSDGTAILQGSGTSNTVGYWYYPNNDSSNKDTYGLLYNWTSVMNNASSSNSNPSGVQGICPTGWHVPSVAEWTQLTDYVGSQSAYQCGGSSTNIAKALASATGWSSSTVACAVGNNLISNNATGFSAVPAGGYYGNCNYFGYYAYFWSATQYNSSYAYGRNLGYNDAGVGCTTSDKYFGFSVRCLRD